MASFERTSPALKEILLRIYGAEKPIEVDHHLYEFGSVEYHIKSSASDPQLTYLSISTPLLTQGVLLSYGLSPYTIQMVREISTDVLEIVEPAKEGYQLTLRLDFSKIPHGKDIHISFSRFSEGNYRRFFCPSRNTKFSAERNVAECEFLGYISRDVQTDQTCLSLERTLLCHQTASKNSSSIPMRFKEYSDVIIATSFFQELMDVGSSEKWAKAPPCSWSPIPPPELRGEPFEDLSTNGGFVSFDISSHHVESKRLDKTVWSLLNFYAYVKHHVKCTRGFIQRRMRRRLESLVEVLQNSSLKEDGHIKKVLGWQYMKKLVRLSSKPKILKRRCHDFTRKIMGIRFRIKIHGFRCFRRRWLTMPKFSSSMGYTKLK
ncbi:hypothetical protein CRYUN_Cryun10bG0027800 [Craigia yunnanensis]